MEDRRGDDATQATGPADGARSGAATLAALGVLYLAQGLPFGFQAHGLRAYLRESGMDLAQVGLAGALAAPWMLKALWAPLVDRHGHDGIGRRRSWILPLQILLALTCAAVALAPPAKGLAPLLALVLLLNLFAATQDIAVDGLAIDVLRPSQLGRGNAAQVVGFKVGMLLGGGLLIWASAWIGWGGMFGAMGGLVLLALGATLTIREAPRSAAQARESGSVGAVLATTLAALRAPRAGWLLAFIGTYKLGEALVDAMFSPFLIDAGYTPQQIGLWVGSYGMAASVAGSLAGGEIARRLPLLGAIGLSAGMRTAALCAPLALAIHGKPSPEAIIAATVSEHFFGGALTTAMFAFMMSRVRRSVGATHYTLLATVEGLGKSPALLSGFLVAALGYAGLFAVGVALSAAFLLLLLPLREPHGPGERHEPFR